MKILITICARGGSKGIPGKNIKNLNGKPLISYSIDVARQFQKFIGGVDIVLSTDSAEIVNTAEIFGLKTEYRRPEFLAGDNVGKVDAIKDVLFWKENHDICLFDFVLDLDVTSPLRNLHDLTESFKLLRDNEEAINLFSVSPAGRSPYFNMVEQKENGFYAQVKKTVNTVLTRQNAPEVYDMNASFYFYKREFFNRAYTSVITDKSIIYKIPHVCFDLDHPIDFDIITYLIENKKLDFEL